MDHIKLDICREENRLRKCYDDLHEKWKKEAKEAVTDDEYKLTRTSFEESLKAYKQWQEFFFENARKLLATKSSA